MKQKKKTKTRTIFHTDVYIYLRHTFQPTPIPYRYRFQTPDSSHYYAASFELKLENLEAFPWNTLDTTVCNRGDCGQRFSEVCFKKFKIIF